ncbi:hypothetical protein Aph01nite_09670 [Acrocarpospora phusangensis]|uniref:Uncharacterized protein n=1 Tax=Acrocarpospora phusangensis TaxID=1070424 RepID=A0A919Q5G6_9ACTN|nr:hypothetical protein Aph01nite_09670 [Acrocarpospora phusangensis]
MVDVTGDQFEEGGPEVIQYPAEAGARSLAHARQYRRAIRSADGQKSIHSVAVVNRSSSSGMGVTPSPGPVGTAM